MNNNFEVRCNNCDWEGYENDLEIFEDTFKEERFDREFFKGCPNCKTDDYLMDIENKINLEN
jgi:hypothetical protein